jgi:predicted  nucleic acid-binding Zn-ribbon protein
VSIEERVSALEGVAASTFQIDTLAQVASVSGGSFMAVYNPETDIHHKVPTSTLAVIFGDIHGLAGGAVTSANLANVCAALRDDITSIRTKYTSTASRLVTTSGALSDKIDTEITDRQNTSAALRSDITSIRTKYTSTASRLVTTSGALSDKIDTEITNRQATSAALRSDITSIRTKYTSTASRLVTTSGALSDKIDTEITNRQATSAALRSDITSIRTKYTSTASRLVDASTALSNDIDTVSAALRTDITSIRTKYTSTASRLVTTSGNLANANAAVSNRVTYWDVESTTGAFTFVSADSGKLWVMKNTTSLNLNLVKTMPLGWNVTLLRLGTAAVVVSAQASTSLVNASAHSGLNNYGSGAVLAVVNQEGSNSHAWYWLQGETE